MKYIIVLSLIVLAVVPTQSRILQAANATQASAQANIGLDCIARDENDRSCDKYVNQSAMLNGSLPVNSTLAASNSEMELHNSSLPMVVALHSEAERSEMKSERSEMKSEEKSEMKSEEKSEMKSEEKEMKSEEAPLNSSLVTKEESFKNSTSVIAPAPTANAQASLGGICVARDENDRSCDAFALNSSLPVVNSSLPVVNSSLLEANSSLPVNSTLAVMSEAKSEMRSDVNIANSTIAGGRVEGDLGFAQTNATEIIPEGEREMSGDELKGMWSQAKQQGDKFMNNVSAGAMMVCGALTMAVTLMI